jgi:hypothetical protein
LTHHPARACGAGTPPGQEGRSLGVANFLSLIVNDPSPCYNGISRTSNEPISSGGIMRPRILAAAVLFSLCSVPAFAAKDCNELKMEIAAKIEANGVKSYELNIVKNDEAKPDDKVVGTCGGGTMKIVYVRKDAEPAPKEKSK